MASTMAHTDGTTARMGRMFRCTANILNASARAISTITINNGTAMTMMEKSTVGHASFAR